MSAPLPGGGSARIKTLSESSDDFPALGRDSAGSAGGPAGLAGNGGGAADSKYLYDVDGKFPYSVYAKKPELYDIDGKHTYKFFNQLKHLKNPNSATKKELQQENVGYDLDGKFSYEVYNPSVHQTLFAAKSK